MTSLCHCNVPLRTYVESPLRLHKYMNDSLAWVTAVVHEGEVVVHAPCDLDDQRSGLQGGLRDGLRGDLQDGGDLDEEGCKR